MTKFFIGLFIGIFLGVRLVETMQAAREGDKLYEEHILEQQRKINSGKFRKFDYHDVHFDPDNCRRIHSVSRRKS